ncbi:serine/threonine protein kinase [Herpetosiphon giganteus]|uniref:serine/threonine protein kinase n=1 Tax=Herpetosiphon giganteus TaxID=2029754 RepID=UPI00195D36C9|nr:serine/threonine-protein kinase [Herpetosiphon giganteus]MBM7841602.1 serine/threonine protein kinase [Herpetosiphon giganteus]
MSVLQSGVVLNNQYEIIKKIGGGGGGNVYEAVDQNLARRVAVKHLILPSNDAIKHFKKEARLLASLEHPNLPQVYNQFEEGPGHFLVMEYIEGTDLDQYLRDQAGPLALTTVLAWADELLKLLEYLHTAPKEPVIHRDIKPANIKLSTTGQLKLIDFGLAKSDLSTQINNVYMSVRGYTSTYAPLEQLVPKDDERTDQRSDVYAFGITLYHLLTGSVPIDANKKQIDATNRYAMVIQSKPDPILHPKQLNPAIPEYVDAAIMQAIAINKSDRFGSAAEFRQALNPSPVSKFSSGFAGLLSARPKAQPAASKSTQSSKQAANSTGQRSQPAQPSSTPPISRPASDHFEPPIPPVPNPKPKSIKRFVPLLALLLLGMGGGGWWWVNANPSSDSTTLPNQNNQPIVYNAVSNPAATLPSSSNGSAAQPTTTLSHATATLEPSATATLEPSAIVTSEPTIAVVVQPTARPATARPAAQPTQRPAPQPTKPPPPASDRDGDGVADANDPCPDTNGPNNGCPPPPPDRDGDGVVDVNDPCPDTNGPNNGCPAPVEPTAPPAVADSDGDTIPDDRDACPNEPGDPSRNGCPKPVEAPPTNTPRPTERPTDVPKPTKIVETPKPTVKPPVTAP